MAASLLALGLWLLAGRVHAQVPVATTPPLQAPSTLAPAVMGPARTLSAVPPARIDPHLQQAQLRPAAQVGGLPTQDFDIRFELPGPELLFRLDSEAALMQRMKQERRNKGKKDELVFPEEPVLSRDAYHGRDWPRMKMVVEPHYVCHKRLLFEEPNSERYGWEIGLFQPLISYGWFFKDVILLPMHLGSYPCRWYECSAGKCLPGDPVPLLLYPPEITLTGLLAEAGTIALFTAIFP